ncbi:LysR family transcriptional regulator [Brochothrix campestris]|uniref:LysR family transcriptional regulator n=1 Tax=Brochothrix campestris FSL F6-1037 TaxID=1265861 RepID=W7CUU2_9LIST|nr:LysR family transcriptional regulator [Brochothrix campestris]EUJ36713.1 LysR family transcriptional regulator [Brochothrix campestris FSL F6-1037]
MNLRHLMIFKQVAKDGSVTLAANNLLLSQPAVSRSLKELETELKISLFDRAAGKIHLNQAGKMILAKATAVLSLIDDISEISHKLAQQNNLRIGSTITVATSLLSQIIKTHEQRYPDNKVTVQIENPGDLEQKILNNELDLAIGEGVSSYDKITSVTISEYDLVFICSVNNPLAQKERVTIDDVLKERLLLREKGSAIRDTFDNYLAMRNLNPEALWTSVNSPSLIQAVSENLGVSLLAPDIVRQVRTNDAVKILTVENFHLTNSMSVIFRNDKANQPGVKEMIAIVQEIVQ